MNENNENLTEDMADTKGPMKDLNFSRILPAGLVESIARRRHSDGTKWREETEFYLPKNDYYCNRLSTVNTDIWLPCTSVNDRDEKILIYTQNWEVIDVIVTKQFQIFQPTAVLQISPKQVVLSSFSGLFLYEINNRKFKLLCKGKFSAVSQHAKTIYALNMTTKEITLLEEKDTWQVSGNLKINTPVPYLMNKSDTLFVTSTNIYICSYHENIIFMCSKNDGAVVSQSELVRIQPSKNGGPAIHNVVLCAVVSEKLSQDHHLLVKLDDPNMSINNNRRTENVSFLAIDTGNEEVVVLTYNQADDTWSTTDTCFKLNQPVDVIAQNDHTLWFLCNNGNKIVKYTKK